MTPRSGAFLTWTLGNAVAMAPFAGSAPDYVLTAVLAGTALLAALWVSPSLARSVDAACRALGPAWAAAAILGALLSPHHGGLAVALLLAYACRKEFTPGDGPRLRARIQRAAAPFVRTCRAAVRA